MKTMLYCLACLLLTAACHTNKQPQQPPVQKEQTTVDKNAASIFDLASTWKTEEGNTIHLRDLKGKTLVVVMIYTSCKSACPRLVADMLAISEKVPDRAKNNVQYVLVSIDPEHDTPEKLKEFAISKSMDGKEWTFLQGNPETVREFANVLAVKYKEISPMDFSHSNIISVFDPAGRLVHQQEGLGVNNQATVDAIIKTAGNE